MILPDINLLVYAHNRRSAKHRPALEWWNACLAGSEGVALAWVVVLGFIRVTTHPKVFERPLPVAEALDRAAEWLSLPHVRIVDPPRNHLEHIAGLLQQVGTAGNLTTDAHLAALAISRGLVLHSTDDDFSRFAGLKWRNPLAG